MKKYLSFAVFALLVAFTSLGLSSCGSDDDDVVNPIIGNSMDNGHEYVDLGLPSGLKWATCNVGADSPEVYGTYFAWGETKAKWMYNWSTYSWGTDWDELTKYCNDSSYGKDGFTDNKTELVLDDDVAHKQWGGSWRMPSVEQFEELFSYTTSQWVTVNGKEGRLFTASNGNSIFLPVADRRYDSSLGYAGSDGYYWSRTLNADYPDGACGLGFGSGGIIVYDYGRDRGHTVRPVRP